MSTATYSVSVSAGGISISRDGMTRTGDGNIGVDPTIIAAKAVGAWVKTDADTAAGTLTTGHGWTTGTYDVYWTGGARYDVAVTITGDALALDGGTGTDFPASANTTVVLAKQTAFNVGIDGDLLEILALKLEFADASLSSAGRVLFEDSANDDIASVVLAGNVPQVWDVDGGATNPFTGDVITHAKASHANTTYTATLKICGVQDVTP